MPIRLAILVSGRGSNMSAILKAIEEGRLNAAVSLVFSNNPQAPALETARAHGVPVESVASAGRKRAEHEALTLATLSRHQIDYVVLAGYMRVLTGDFLRHFACDQGYYRIINIHPSLLPAFPGANAYEDAFNYGVRLSGITVHLVDEKVDHGPILSQQSFPRLESDTFETFRQRGLSVEHELYPKVLQSIAEEGVKLLPARSSAQLQETSSK